MSRELKLIYPFNTAANLEVEYLPGKWARVTPAVFRCWCGNRRLNKEDYTGPVFYERTNKVYYPTDNDISRVVGVQELNDPKLISRRQLKTITVVGQRRKEKFK